jgi:adsorption protein B
MMVLIAIWVLLSGLDDLFLDLAWLYRWLFTECPKPPSEADLAIPQKRIAIFVPLWHEYRVAKTMIEHSLATVRYSRCDFFIGVYPNDLETLSIVRELDARFFNVHLAVCPHDGPTSKADNLNWIFQRMMLFEVEHEARFETVITHDAEDLIHPEALRWINYYSEQYDMVQIPVLPLPTPASELLHGVYCDEFAEYQSKDLPTRQFLGGFLPSCGVGTGFSRRALDRLGAAYGNCIFEPKCLTEDYENGFRLHHLGCSQIFVPITMVATRSFFPRTFGAAVKQRTRWLMGITLQSWELHGWRDTFSQLYWFWRDRKGLVGSLLGPVANLVFISAPFLDQSHSWILATFIGSMILQAIHIGVRARCSARIYGWKFASLTPARVLYGNLVNFVATACAIDRYCRAKWRGQELAWLKTDHAYPNREALTADHRRLGEILVGSQYVLSVDVEAALESQPPGLRIGEYLVFLGKLSESDLYDCLSLQQSVSFEKLDSAQINRPITRALPMAISRKWRVLGYKVASGQLFVAGPDAPSEQMSDDLRRFSSLEIRFHLITPANFEALRNEFLPSVLDVESVQS